MSRLAYVLFWVVICALGGSFLITIGFLAGVARGDQGNAVEPPARPGDFAIISESNGVALYRDPETGCEYVAYMRGGIILRAGRGCS